MVDLESITVKENGQTTTTVQSKWKKKTTTMTLNGNP
jgi:hypothetical protein